MGHANGTERVRWVALLALLLPLTGGYNTADLVISTPEELKPMVLRVSHPEVTCFTPELQAAMPHALNPKVTDKPELIVEKLVRVSCGKHKCTRPQPIWWIEEHIKVVQLLTKMRKSRACPTGSPYVHARSIRCLRSWPAACGAVTIRVWRCRAQRCCGLAKMQENCRVTRATAARRSSSSSPRRSRCYRHRPRALTGARRTNGSSWTAWPSARRATSTRSSSSIRSLSTATGA
jgi:hypothetical protein